MKLLILPLLLSMFAFSAFAQKDKIKQLKIQMLISAEQKKEFSSGNSETDCVTMKFHYLVTLDFMLTSKIRRIEVFMNEKAFSEENLKTLFAYLSDKYTSSEDLNVIVNTNWNQLQLPTDCLPLRASNQPDKPDKYDYHQAIFNRRGKIKYFRYNPVLKTSIFKKVTMNNNSQ
ncbi:MAG TPA: hypothetical protein VF599_23035 [Pyrinomonadaceae bacterium]